MGSMEEDVIRLDGYEQCNTAAWFGRLSFVLGTTKVGRV